MRKKTSLIILVLLSCSVFLMGFQERDSTKLVIQRLIEEAVEKKLQKYRNTRFKKCRRDLLREAGKRADSIIIVRAKALKVIQDTMTRPIAPDRPDRPELLEPIDSSFPTPLLKDSTLLLDTIQEE